LITWKGTPRPPSGSASTTSCYTSGDRRPEPTPANNPTPREEADSPTVAYDNTATATATANRHILAPLDGYPKTLRNFDASKLQVARRIGHCEQSSLFSSRVEFKQDLLKSRVTREAVNTFNKRGKCSFAFVGDE
jgi:hypothetical protein